MGCSQKEYWSGLPCPPPGDLPSPGIKPECPALQEDSLPAKLPGKPICQARMLQDTILLECQNKRNENKAWVRMRWYKMGMYFNLKFLTVLTFLKERNMLVLLFKDKFKSQKHLQCSLGCFLFSGPDCSGSLVSKVNGISIFVSQACERHLAAKEDKHWNETPENVFFTF